LGLHPMAMCFTLVHPQFFTDHLQPPQPPCLQLLQALPFVDILAIAAASHGVNLSTLKAASWVLQWRHAVIPSLPRTQDRWFVEAARHEEAFFAEDFTDGWAERWAHQGSVSYAMVQNVCRKFGTSFSVLSIGAPFKQTIFPGCGVVHKLPLPICATEFSWMARVEGTLAACDGRICCVSCQDDSKMEVIRTYFCGGNIWWEAGESSPIPLLPCGDFQDGHWYRIACQFDWHTHTCSVIVETCTDGTDDPADSLDHPVQKHQLGFHCAGASNLNSVTLSSVAFGSSRLSGCTAHITALRIFQGLNTFSM